jgi:hypothetical protein
MPSRPSSDGPVQVIAAIEPARPVDLLRQLTEARAARAEGEWWAFVLARTDRDGFATSTKASPRAA